MKSFLASRGKGLDWGMMYNLEGYTKRDLAFLKSHARGRLIKNPSVTNEAVSSSAHKRVAFNYSFKQ